MTLISTLGTEEHSQYGWIEGLNDRSLPPYSKYPSNKPIGISTRATNKGYFINLPKRPYYYCRISTEENILNQLSYPLQTFIGFTKAIALHVK